MPFDASQAFFGGFHQGTSEQNYAINVEQPNRVMVASMQSSNRKKEVEQGSNADKGKKPIRGGHEKAKVILTCHKASQKDSWLKQGGSGLKKVTKVQRN